MERFLCNDTWLNSFVSTFVHPKAGSRSLIKCEQQSHEFCSSLSSSAASEYSVEYSVQNADAPTEPQTSFTDYPVAEKWIVGFFFTLLVCSCASFGACLRPLMRKPYFDDILSWMVGLGVGCLSGIALFHLIPQSFELPSQTEAEIDAYLHKSVTIMAAIYVFYLAERIFKIALDSRQNKEERFRRLSSRNYSFHSHDGRRRSSTHAPRYHSIESLQRAVKKDVMGEVNGDVKEETSGGKLIAATSGLEAKKGHCGHAHALELEDENLPAVVWMILVGDGLHKFVDGLSIGAAFSMSTLQGMAIALAVFCEELPHELGDMAILINSGMSFRRALTYNCLTGISCLAGFAIGVVMGDFPGTNTWIFAVAGGMFLYISLVNLVPEMVAVVEEACQSSLKKGMFVLFIQNTGFLFGVGCMYILARFAHQIEL